MTYAAAAAIEITHDTNHVAKNLSFPARNNEPDMIWKDHLNLPWHPASHRDSNSP